MRRSGPSSLLVSLDFELSWGFWDLPKRPLVPMARTAELVPELVDLFREVGVRCTWATVGALAFESGDDLRAFLVDLGAGRSWFERMDRALSRATAMDRWFGPELVGLVSRTEGQELGSHGLLHWPCREIRVPAEDLSQDLELVNRAWKDKGFGEPRSYVFPRNQIPAFGPECLGRAGYSAYRSNQRGWPYEPGYSLSDGRAMRAARLLGRLTPLRGATACSMTSPVALPATRFLVVPTSKLARKASLRAVRSEVREAVRTGRDLHFWWHPHNGAGAPREAMAFWRDALVHAVDEVSESGGRCRTMGELAAARAPGGD